jgi:hypothetical protein
MRLREVMKALPKILLALTAVAALSVAYPAKANLITNGGFEEGNGLSGWSFTGTVGVSGFAHTGNNAVSFGAPGGSLSQNVTTTPGASYVVDFWLATTNIINSFPVSVNVLWGGTTIFSHLFSSNQGYAEYTFNVTTSSAMTALEFQSSSSFGSLQLDDVSVTPAGVPDGGSTVSLLGCALLGLTALRRKLSC